MDGPRTCEEREFDDAISLINQQFRAGTDQDIPSDYPLVFDPSRTEYMRVLKVDGKVVAHVPVAPREVISTVDRFRHRDHQSYSDSLGLPQARICNPLPRGLSPDHGGTGDGGLRSMDTVGNIPFLSKFRLGSRGLAGLGILAFCPGR